MSYILDALKRADTERNRGAVPGLHARQLPSSGNAAASPQQNLVWWLMATAGVLGALAAGLWVWRTQPATPGVLAPTPLVVMAVPTPPQSAPAAVAPSAQPTSPKPAVKAVSPPTEPTTAPAPATPTPTPAATPLLSELPDTLRRQLPKLAITGTVYAEDPKQRLLLVNNQVLPQGSVLAPELTLEEIRPHHSVFNFRGTQFRVAH